MAARPDHLPARRGSPAPTTAHRARAGRRGGAARSRTPAGPARAAGCSRSWSPRRCSSVPKLFSGTPTGPGAGALRDDPDPGRAGALQRRARASATVDPRGQRRRTQGAGDRRRTRTPGPPSTRAPTVDLTISQGKPDQDVPDLVGSNKDTAARAAARARAQGRRSSRRSPTSTKDDVVAMSPAAGTRSPDGSTVTLFYSDGPRERART